ncbi:hypothetical protein L207DRAFT_556251 [Hyaloscypha variabilis F]|uniref:Uncharacterized protein n=1 Tax=Hyaloscypha variabilis (strain UAMH 11265 / GT02V1 / F) TaxID=1149755 RepID=A0A2J6RE29_HYAVF|nr:hypothetical protein L207DRAFT_556251 [Hyaloscypha variabilis F]
MASPTPKSEMNAESSSFDAPTLTPQRSSKMARVVESAGTGLTILALLAAITIVVTAADALAVYNTTSLPSDHAYLLPLWPADFNMRPSVALVACGSIIIVASAASLIHSKVSAIRNAPFIHSSIGFVGPAISLIAGLVATSFFYGVNASSSTYTLHSWSCQWSPVSMDVKPHWDVLCRETSAAIYLMVMMIPLEILVLGSVAYSKVAGQKQSFERERKGSPTMT